MEFFYRNSRKNANTFLINEINGILYYIKRIIILCLCIGNQFPSTRRLLKLYGIRVGRVKL